KLHILKYLGIDPKSSKVLEDKFFDEEALKFDRTLMVENKPITFEFSKVNIATVGAIGIALDVTENRRYKNKAEHLRLTMETVISFVSSSIMVVGSDGKMVYYNDAFLHLFDVKAEWLEGVDAFSDLLDRKREKGRLEGVG